MYPRRFVTLALALAVSVPVHAQAKDKKVDGHANTFVLGLPVAYNAARKWPLLILLHGSGDRAERMFPLWRTAELTRHVIVVALNSRNPQGWDGEDEKAILDLIPQLSKEYSVDPAQVWIGGFSAGGFMAAAVEVQYHKLFAGAVIMGSGDVYAQRFKDDYRMAAVEGHFYLFVGEKDPNNPVMKQTDKNLETFGCKNKKFVEVPGIGHTYRPEDVQDIGKWLVAAIQKVAITSELSRKDLKKRLDEAERAAARQEYSKASAGFQAILETVGKDTDFGKKATKGLAELQKKAEDLMNRAKDTADRAERNKLLEDFQKKFEGTEWAQKAEELKS
jgi:predicted esterase